MECLLTNQLETKQRKFIPKKHTVLHTNLRQIFIVFQHQEIGFAIALVTRKQ